MKEHIKKQILEEKLKWRALACLQKEIENEGTH